MENIPETFEYFMQAEILGSEILSTKEQIFSLHKGANECREAIGEMNRSGFKSAYMYEGALLVRSTREEILDRLGSRCRRLNEEIKAKGDELKKLVFRLQDLEHQTPYRGRALLPLDGDEMRALGQVWGGARGSN